jgi:beta-lactam-binding protein with PASTA domain
VTVKRFFGLLLLAALAFGLGVVLAHVWVLPRLIHRQQVVIVPDLTGQQVDVARSEAARLGFGLEIVEEAPRGDTPAGVVLEQQPRPLRSMRKGRPIRVTVSKGESLGQAPDLSSMTLRQVEITLLRESLVLGIVARTFDPKGRLGVVAQFPRAGTPVARGAVVDVLLREGIEAVDFMVPTLVGRNLQSVQRELERAGFKVRRATFRRDRGALPGTVLEQWPQAGSRVHLGESFELVAASSG